jgi:hypothetical protein
MRVIGPTVAYTDEELLFSRLIYKTLRIKIYSTNAPTVSCVYETRSPFEECTDNKVITKIFRSI